MRIITGSIVLVGIALAAPAGSQTNVRPIEFFEGTTISEGTLKVAMQRTVKTRSVNRGTIEPNGALVLVQTVQDEGKPATERRWRIYATGPGKYAGTMSEATGPVAIQQVGTRYRFRFKMKGGLSVEQWLAPLADGNRASSTITVRKLGLTVATSQATIRKVASG